MHKYTLATAILTFWASAVGFAEVFLDRQAADTYNRVFGAWVAKHRAALAIVVARQDSKIVFSKGHGTNADAPILISSMSKPITGVCIGTLIRDGRLAFTTPLGDALASFFHRHGPPADRRVERITIEQLLTHRSGLLGIRDNEPLQAIWRQRAEFGLAHVASAEPLLAEIFKHPLAHDPGFTGHYSNAGFIVLTAVVEEISGQSYENYCQIALFDKLGITSARLHHDWRMFSGARGWVINGFDYLTFLAVFDPKNPFLGGSIKQWIIANTKRPSDDGDRIDGLGIPTEIKSNGWEVKHTGVLLNFQGKSYDGRPTNANSHSHAYRKASGFSMFLAVSPVVMGEVLSELDETVYQVHARAQNPP